MNCFNQIIVLICIVVFDRFVHPKESLYDLSEMFANEMTKHFRFVFPRLMDRLDKILCNEGLSLDQGGFAKTPFTCFSITRDYECVPHDDPTDYGYGIIVWLYPSKYNTLSFEFIHL